MTDRERWSLATVAGFAGLRVGLLTPVYLFAQRLAVQEERLRVVMDGVAEIRSEVKSTGADVAKLRETLASRSSRER